MLSRTDAPAAPFQGGRLERTPSLGAALDAFLEDKALSSRARRGGTVKNLRSQLRPLAGDTRPVAHFDARFCRALMASRAPQLQTSSLKTLWGALSVFGGWCADRGFLPYNPLREVAMPRPREKPHRYLTPDELRRLFAAAALSRKPDELRLALLLLLEGLRVQELCDLRWQDVGADRIGVDGKGGRARVIPLRPATAQALALQPRAGRTIFAFAPDALRERLRRLERRARLPRLHPHLLRHTWASLQRIEGMDTGTLETLGGWVPGSAQVERYTRSARQDAALARARDFDLVGRIFSDLAGQDD